MQRSVCIPLECILVFCSFQEKCASPFPKALVFSLSFKLRKLLDKPGQQLKNLLARDNIYRPRASGQVLNDTLGLATRLSNPGSATAMHETQYREHYWPFKESFKILPSLLSIIPYCYDTWTILKICTVYSHQTILHILFNHCLTHVRMVSPMTVNGLYLHCSCSLYLSLITQSFKLNATAGGFKLYY